MKRIFFTACLAACLAGFSSFASERISPDILSSFFHTFKKAENISWVEVDDMLRISFTQDGQQRFAYYSNDELVVVATEIKVQELPSALQEQVAKYKDYKVTQVYQLEAVNMKEYCVMLQNSDGELILKGKNKLRTLQK